MEITKAPFNYIGNKYRIMDSIQRYFPHGFNTMVDLFCGGCDVTINTPANKIYANDINSFLIGICKEFQNRPIEEILTYIDQTIDEWGLSKENKIAYDKFRAHYNKTKKPLDLYVLICFSFNYQFRFNTAHEYNNPFGKNRSSFNETMRHNLIKFKERIGSVVFSSQDFIEFDYSVLGTGDFIYADPPYLISCGSYNDGKRGFKGWKQKDDIMLYDILTNLSERGVNFALSNVIAHKGLKNEILINWAKKYNYNIHPINFDYNNCNYHTNNRLNQTQEVLITNY